jgi:hypothetical protein
MVREQHGIIAVHEFLVFGRISEVAAMLRFALFGAGFIGAHPRASPAYIYDINQQAAEQ